MIYVGSSGIFGFHTGNPGSGTSLNDMVCTMNYLESVEMTDYGTSNIFYQHTDKSCSSGELNGKYKPPVILGQHMDNSCSIVCLDDIQ
jgi:hypothetical protein